MTFFEFVLISFVFCVNFVEVADGKKNCIESNRVGTCSLLSCGNLCEKRSCVKDEKLAASSVAILSSITVGVCVLFAIIVVLAVMWIRSRRLRKDDPDRKMSVRPAENPYAFRNHPRPPMTGLATFTLNLHPPLPALDDEDENPYDYETVDFPKLKTQTTNTEVDETEGGYLIPTPLARPKLPPPNIWDPTN